MTTLRWLMILVSASGALLTAQDRYVVVVSIDGFPAYALKDPTIPLPNLRKLASEGVMAESMRPVNPTVTWPNHTAIVTGVTPARHSVLYNGWAVRGAAGEAVKVEPRVPKTELVQGTTLYDVAHLAGLKTAEVDWVAIEKAPTITWSFAEWASPEGSLEKEMIAAGVVSEKELTAFTKGPITQRDEVWTQAGEYLIAKHQPNLLLLHLLTTDSIQHRYGARSLAAQTAFALADAKVGRLVEACRKAGILPKTTFVIVSDHGFKTYQKVVRPNVLLQQKGLGDKVWAIPEGGTAMVYVTQPADKEATVAAVKAAFTGVDGVTRVLEPSNFDEFGYPQPKANTRMADLVLAAGEGYGFDGATGGGVTGPVPAGTTPGSHGFLNSDPDMQAIFIASGAGVKRGAALGSIRNLDVAPTIARWLGLEMKNVEGRTLTEILE